MRMYDVRLLVGKNPMKHRRWSTLIAFLFLLANIAHADEGTVGDKPQGRPASWAEVMQFLRDKCATGAPPEDQVQCKGTLQLSRGVEWFSRFFKDICDESQKFPELACSYFLSMHPSNDEVIWNQHCKKILEENDPRYAKACKTFVEMMVQQSSPWLKKNLLLPCTQAANGPACDKGMEELCSKDSYLCQKSHEVFTKEVNTALAGSSQMCQKDNYAVKFYCDSIQKSVIESPNWMDQQCARVRSAQQLCKGQWPPACEIYKTVCNNGKMKECAGLNEQNTFCKEISTNGGTEAAYEKYCKGEKVNDRYCNGVHEDLDKDSEKFTRICTESCQTSDKNPLCAYCQKLIEEDPRKLWAQCHNEELLHSAYCQRIIEYCTSYSTTGGCPQVLRENVLWNLEFGNSNDTAELVEKLAKLCEKEPSAECKTGVENILKGPNGGNFPAIHSAVCAKYQSACRNIIEVMKDRLDDLTKSCDASTWANLSSCKVVLDECISKKYECQVLQKKQESTDDFNKFGSVSPAEKKAMLEKYCPEDKVNTPICQAFLEKSVQLPPAEQNSIIPGICEAGKTELCKAILDSVARKGGSAMDEMAKEQCNPWKSDNLFCKALDDACRNVTSTGCNAVAKIQCEAKDPANMNECLESIHRACKQSPTPGDPLYEQCKTLSETVAKNPNAAKGISELCESPDPRDKAVCRSILDNAEASGQLKDIVSNVCTKENMESILCQAVQGQCKSSNSAGCEQAKEVMNNAIIELDACKTDSNECREALQWYCMKSTSDKNDKADNTDNGANADNADNADVSNSSSSDDTARLIRNTADATAQAQTKVRNKEKCKALFDNMPKDVAVEYHKLCVDKRNADEICEITGGKLNTDGTLYDAFVKHCSGHMIAERGCKTIYDTCKKYHSDGSAGCDKVINRYELEEALASSTTADLNKTADAMGTICGPGKDEQTCNEFLMNNKTSDTLLIGSLQQLCSQKKDRETCRKILESLLKGKSPLLNKIGVMCSSSQMSYGLCDELTTLCKNYQDVPVCKDMLASQKQREDIEKLSSDPTQAAELLKKYCTGPKPDPRMCELVKSNILASPDVIISQLDKICEISPQLCVFFTEAAIKENQSTIPVLFKKYCEREPHPQICKVIGDFCEGSMSRECKNTRNRVCLLIETIDKCVSVVNKECSFDQTTRTTAQVQTCDDLAKQAADSKQKIVKLQVICEGNASACSGFVMGTLDTNTGYSVFETWCPKQDYGLLKCKTFREQCRLRTEHVDCTRINAVFAEFDPMACRDKDEKTCMDALTANCDPTVPSAEERARCDELFANMGKDDLLKLKGKCSSGNSPKTCARIVEKLKEVGGIESAYKDWCVGENGDKNSAQCKEIEKGCQQDESDGCAFVNSRLSRPQRIGSIVGMIVGALIIALGIVFWVILGVNRSKHDDEKERLRQAKKEEKRRKREERKQAKKSSRSKSSKSSKKDDDNTTRTTTERSSFGP